MLLLVFLGADGSHALVHCHASRLQQASGRDGHSSSCGVCEGRGRKRSSDDEVAYHFRVVLFEEGVVVPQSHLHLPVWSEGPMHVLISGMRTCF